jgi:UDPglucose 6-dehydrogenase
VVFINELATLCEQIGADAKEVERGLKSESRIGPKSYLSPGSAFAGGTLARDIAFLTALGTNTGVTTPLFASIRTSNESHKAWAHRKLLALFGGSLRGKTIGVWGLTYKPGTDTLRRSSSIALCNWIHSQGASVVAHDPAVKSLPPELQSVINLKESAAEAAREVDALVVSTQWPVYREVVLDTNAELIVIDESRFLRERFEGNARVRYFTIGKGLP